MLRSSLFDSLKGTATVHICISVRTARAFALKPRQYTKLYFEWITDVLFVYGLPSALSFILDYWCMLKTISRELNDVRKLYRSTDPGITYKKYLDLEYWLFVCLLRFYRLKLHVQGYRAEILDLGTGTGYFPYICRFYGNIAEGLDVSNNNMYNDIVRALNIKRYGQFITYDSRLLPTKRYDYVTAFMICFNEHKKDTLWHIAEWECFLKELKQNNLKPGGQVYLSFNAESDQQPVSKELLMYFKTRNAKIIGNSNVLLDSSYIY